MPSPQRPTFPQSGMTPRPRPQVQTQQPQPVPVSSPAPAPAETAQEKEKKVKRRTLQEKIDYQAEKLAKLQADRDNTAQALKVLRASLAAKERKKAAAKRTHEFILLGIFFEHFWQKVATDAAKMAAMTEINDMIEKAALTVQETEKALTGEFSTKTAKKEAEKAARAAKRRLKDMEDTKALLNQLTQPNQAGPN